MYDERLGKAHEAGYEQFVAAVINRRPNAISMPTNSAEAYVWSLGVLRAAKQLTERNEAILNGNDPFARDPE